MHCVAALALGGLSTSAYAHASASVFAYTASEAFSASNTGSSLDDCLRANLSPQATLVPAGSSAFVNDTIRWTTLGSPSYALAVDAACEQDIAVSVRQIPASRSYVLMG